MLTQAGTRVQSLPSGIPLEEERRGSRVLVIDYDPDLSQVLADLLAEAGVSVSVHTCQTEGCQCAALAGSARPDVILVNVARPDGRCIDVRGWRSLIGLCADSSTLGTEIMAYTVLDRDTLREMGVDPRQLGVRLRATMTDPGVLVDETVHALQFLSAA